MGVIQSGKFTESLLGIVIWGVLELLSEKKSNFKIIFFKSPLEAGIFIA